VCKQIIHPNKLDSFRSLARQAIVDIKSGEAGGTLSFQFHFSSDHGDEQSSRSTSSSTHCHTLEHYRDSAAAAEHIHKMQQNKHRNAAITECAKIIVLEVYGPASAELKELLRKEEYIVAYHGPCEISLL
jgi:quinol monooxygenase YgiN